MVHLKYFPGNKLNNLNMRDLFFTYWLEVKGGFIRERFIKGKEHQLKGSEEATWVMIVDRGFCFLDGQLKNVNTINVQNNFFIFIPLVVLFSQTFCFIFVFVSLACLQPFVLHTFYNNFLSCWCSSQDFNRERDK